MSACVGTETCFSGDYRIIWWVRCHAGSVEIYIRAGSTERGKDSPLIARGCCLISPHSKSSSRSYSSSCPYCMKENGVLSVTEVLHPPCVRPPVLWSISSGRLFPAVLVGGGVWSLYGFARRTLLCYKLMQWRFLVHGHWGNEKNKDTLMLFKATTEELK